MRWCTSFLFLIYSFFGLSQIDQGTNSFHAGGMTLNRETQKLNIYPVFLDTVSGVTYQGKQNYDIGLGYRFSLSNNFSIGLESRFLANRSSSYQIHSGGFSVRYNFPLGQIGKKSSMKNYLVFLKTNLTSRNFFYLDYTALFGTLRFENQYLSYQSNMLQVGVQFRVPVHESKFLRHIGLELSLGGCYRTTTESFYDPFAVSQAKVHYFLDRHYTRTVNNR